jgi:hypothetical protein
MPNDNDLPHIPPHPDDDAARIARDLKHAREQQKIADTYPGRTHQLARKLPGPEPKVEVIFIKDRRRPYLSDQSHFGW